MPHSRPGRAMRPSLTLVLALAAAALLPRNASAQSIFDDWIFNLDGTTQGYWYDKTPGGANGYVTANISKVQYDSSYVYVSAYGCPAYTMDFPQTRYPGVQSYVFKIPRNPTQQTGTKTNIPKGIIGFWIDGVPFYHPGDGKSYSTSGAADSGTGDGIWNSNAVISEAPSLDSNLGHTSGSNPGKYHTHEQPLGLRNYFGDTATAHSPLLGWAFDGYPVYGPYGYCTATDSTSGVCRMTSSYQLRNITVRQSLSDGGGTGGTTALPSSEYGPDVNSTYPLGHYLEDFEWISGLGDLDKYNGRYCVTPEYPGGTYAYFATIDSNGNSAYPYIIGTAYYGVISGMGFNSTSQTVPMGATETQPSCPVTVTPSATSAQPGTSLTASVPDSGTGSTYSWSITNGSITAGSSSRTVTFTTSSSGLTTTITCDVRTPHGCKATGSANVTVSSFAAPASFSATLTAATTATLTWTASTGASKYVIYRQSSAGGGYSSIGSSATTGYADSTLSTNSAYVYYAVASNSDGSIISAPSTVDYVTTYGYTDDPIAAGTTTVKAQHITELRSAIEALDAAIGVSAPAWTDATLSGATIKAIDITELRNGLNSFRSSVLLSTLAFTDPTLTAQSSAIRKVHLSELRVGIKGYCSTANCQ